MNTRGLFRVWIACVLAGMWTGRAEAGSTTGVLWTQTLGDGPILFSGDGSYLASPNAENQLVIRTVPEGDMVQIIDVSANEIAAAALTFGGEELALGHKETIQLWDVDTGTLTATLEGHQENVIALVYDRQITRLVSGDGDGEVRIWSQEKKQTIRALNYRGPPNVLVFRPGSSTTLALRSGSALEYWDIRTGERVTAFDELFFSGRVAFSSDSPVFAYESASGQLTIAYAPLRILEFNRKPDSNSIQLSWIGGTRSYQVQRRNGRNGSWETIVEQYGERFAEVMVPESEVAFYRVVSIAP